MELTWPSLIVIIHLVKHVAININRSGMATIHAGGKGTPIQNQILIGQLFAFDEPGSPALNENA